MVSRGSSIMSSLTELKELADKATPGPWAVDDSDPSDVIVRTALDLRWVANIGNWSRQLPLPPAADNDRLRQVYEVDIRDARYIAACSPEVIRALVAVAEATERLTTPGDMSILDAVQRMSETRVALDALKEVLK